MVWILFERLSRNPKNLGPLQRVPVIANATFVRLAIGLAVPGKAFGQDRHPVHLPVPFSAQHGAGPEFCGTLTNAHGTLSGLLGRPRAIEQALAFAIQVTQLVGLQPVGQNAKQQMAGQVRGRLASRIRCANGCEAHRRRDRASARSRRRVCSAVRQGRTDPDARHGALRATGAWSGKRRACRCRRCNPVDPGPIHLLRAKLELEPLAHHAGQEATHRVLLPAGRLHHGGNRRPRG